MKKYRLKKDLPFAKAGETFGLHRGGIKDCITLFKGDETIYMFQVGENVSEMFDEWFEEVEDVEDVEMPDEFYIPAVYSDKRKIEAIKVNDMVSSSSTLQTIFLNNSEIGSVFKSKEEAERYIEYLKAKAIIKQDTKGFKPDWKNPSQKRFFGYYNLIDKKLNYFNAGENMESKIFFKTGEDIEESFEKHPKEWKAYLTYEQ